MKKNHDLSERIQAVLVSHMEGSIQKETVGEVIAALSYNLCDAVALLYAQTTASSESAALAAINTLASGFSDREAYESMLERIKRTRKELHENVSN